MADDLTKPSSVIMRALAVGAAWGALVVLLIGIVAANLVQP